MKLVIDIPEDLYKAKIRGIASNRQEEKILECVKNGTPSNFTPEQAQIYLKFASDLLNGKPYEEIETLMKQYIEIHKIKCKEEIRDNGKRICRNCKNFDEYDSIFDEEDNEDYFTLFCKVKGEVREPDDEIADKCKDFVLKGENNE